MYAIEFETDIKGEFIRLPQFEKLKNRRVKVILLTEESLGEQLAQNERKKSSHRRAAKVPPIIFKADVIDTVPDTDWNQV